MKKKSIEDFLNDDSRVCFNDFKEQIKKRTEQYNVEKIGTEFINDIDNLMSNVLKKIKENFILVNRKTLEDASKE